MRSIFVRFASSEPSRDSCSPIEELQLRRDGLSNARRKGLIRSRFGRNPHGMVQKTAYSLSIAVSTMCKRLAQEMAMKCFHLRGMLHQEMLMPIAIGQELDFRNNFVQFGNRQNKIISLNCDRRRLWVLRFMFTRDEMVPGRADVEDPRNDKISSQKTTFNII
jgi:hypothetical protein